MIYENCWLPVEGFNNAEPKLSKAMVLVNVYFEISSNEHYTPEFYKIMRIFQGICRQQKKTDSCPIFLSCPGSHWLPSNQRIRENISKFKDCELVKFAQMCFDNCACFNLYFPNIAYELSVRNMKQYLIGAVTICEKPGYFLSHYKMIVYGLIQAKETPVDAIQILLSSIQRNDTLVLRAVFDAIQEIMIKHHSNFNFLDVLIQIADCPVLKCTEEGLNALYASAMKYPDQRWNTIIEKVKN